MVTRRVLVLVAAAGCYRPSPPNGALLCSADGQCPEGYHCAGDGTCWRTGADVDAGGGMDAAPFSQAPRLISPRNGAFTGSARAAMSRRPLFHWAALPEATSYEVEVDADCDPKDFRSCRFSSLDAGEMTSATSLRLSTALPVPTSPPAGQRYYWRVRGCGADRCTPWSEIRYLDVGRNPTDFTGNGDSDLAIGNADASLNGVAGVGTAYIALGVGNGLPGVPMLTPPSGAFGDHYGIATASAGDVDGDGFADLVVAAELANQGGRVYLYRGGANWPTNNPAQTLENPEGQTVAFFGHAMASGDFNGDGHSDLVVGAEIQDGAAPSDGKVFLYAGESSARGLPALPTWTLENPTHQEQGYFGNALAIGDFDGDGYADLAVGARQQDAVGRVFLYRGGPSGVMSSPSAVLDDPAIITNAGFGYALAAGDFDGDGYADLAVGAALENTAMAAAVGHVYVFHGGPGGIRDRAAPWLVLDNPSRQSNSVFGWALVAADFNADAIDDLVVSAFGQDTQAGRVYIYQATGTGLPSMPSRTLSDPDPVNANDGLGYVLAVGDRAPSDGFADLFVGALRDNGTIYLFNGSSGGLPATAISTISGSAVAGISIGPSSLSSAPP
jgi:hypothetical protein